MREAEGYVYASIARDTRLLLMEPPAMPHSALTLPPLPSQPPQSAAAKGSIAAKGPAAVAYSALNGHDGAPIIVPTPAPTPTPTPLGVRDASGDDAYSRLMAATIERNQIHILRLLLTALYVAHVLYAPWRRYTAKFIHLLYAIPHTSPTLYAIGTDDIYYVLFWVVTLTFLRSAVMQYVFTPLAVHGCKIRLRKAITRFAEQGWSNFYYTCLFALGVYLYVGLPYWVMKLDHLYIGWPHHQLAPLFKKYYLILIAFWIQQMIVIQLEERRKDHWQMFSHHVITFLLVVGLYYYYFGRVGHAIMMIMDLVDILLITAKMLKYLGFLRLCDLMFMLFLVAWIVLRHGLYNVIFYHAYLNAGPKMAEMECWRNTYEHRCWSKNIIRTFLGLLGGLQVITIVWMYLICKVAYKVVRGKGADDVRSDEDDTDCEDEAQHEAAKEKSDKFGVEKVSK